MIDQTDTETKDYGFREIAVESLKDVDDLHLSGDDRKIVLESLLKARLENKTSLLMLHDKITTTRDMANGPASSLAEGVGVMGKVSAVFKLSLDILEQVYDDQDGEPALVISPKRLSDNKAEATRQIAQLLSAARQAAGLEEWTSAATIRKVVTNYGRMDTNNFAAILKGMDNVAVIRGQGQSRELKITKPGTEATSELINSLVGIE